jgi:hypothetical protein
LKVRRRVPFEVGSISCGETRTSLTLNDLSFAPVILNEKMPQIANRVTLLCQRERQYPRSPEQ